MAGWLDEGNYVCYVEEGPGAWQHRTGFDIHFEVQGACRKSCYGVRMCKSCFLVGQFEAILLQWIEEDLQFYTVWVGWKSFFKTSYDQRTDFKSNEKQPPGITQTLAAANISLEFNPS